MALWDRSEGLCEMIEEGVRCLRPAVDWHHRVPRGMGGRHGAAKRQSDSLENATAICRFHHHLIHSGQKVKP